MKNLIRILVLLLLVSCSGHGQFAVNPTMEHASWVGLEDSLVISVSPFDGHSDTLIVSAPLTSVVCMSSSFAAGFAEIGAAELVSGVSGLRYISNQTVRGHAAEVGYDAALDFETLLSLKPDVVLAYGLSAATPTYFERLEEMGVRCFQLYDHLEPDPLGRAEYIKIYGAMAGRRDDADSVYNDICRNYETLKASVPRGREPAKVLLNAPLGEAWYVPGTDSYMSRLMRDAGGEILGCKPGVESSVMSLESAYRLSKDADFWLHPGRGKRPSVIEIDKIYDNSLRMTPEGGNDYWERGAIRPDLILSDLVKIFEDEADSLYFYLKL